jgi:hypothetical protein
MVPVPLGQRQSAIDPGHEEHADPRLIASSVALWQRSSDRDWPGKGWFKSDPDYQPVRVRAVAGPELGLELPYPLGRDIRYPPPQRVIEDRDPRGSVLLRTDAGAADATVTAGIPLWALIGYKSLACDPDVQDILRLDPTEGAVAGQVRTPSQVKPDQVFAQALSAVMLNHIRPELAAALRDNPASFNGAEGESGSAPAPTLILTYPSGLPGSLREAVYGIAGRQAMEALFGKAPEDDPYRIELVSEARATAFMAMRTTSRLRAAGNEPIAFPHVGLNRMIIADIGKSTADFCVAQFEANRDGSGSPRPDEATFATRLEFGTRLGGHRLDQALRSSLLAPLDETVRHRLQGTQSWLAHQLGVIHASKVRWSREGETTDGRVEIDLAVSSAASVAPLIQTSGGVSGSAGDGWMTLNEMKALTQLSADELKDKLRSVVERTGTTEVRVERLVSGEGWDLVLTNEAPDGKGRLDRVVPQLAWRIALRGNYDWMLNQPNSPLRAYRQVLAYLCGSLAKHCREKEEPSAPANSGQPGSNVDHRPWLLITGRTALYRLFRPGGGMSDGFPVNGVRRLVVQDAAVRGPKETAAEWLKTAVADGALQMVMRQSSQSDFNQKETLSLGRLTRQRGRPPVFRPLPDGRTGAVLKLGEGEIIVTAPPFMTEDPQAEAALEKHEDYWNDLFRAVVPGERTPDEVRLAEDGEGWILFRVGRAEMRLFPDGRTMPVSDAAAGNIGGHRS